MKKELDTSSQLILNEIKLLSDKKTLWLADEHISSEEINVCLEHGLNPKLDIISNRFHAITSAQFRFNDFELDADQHGVYDAVLIRLPKEKSLYKYIITLAFNALSINGVLFLSGAKNEGIQTAVKFTQELFNSLASKHSKLKPSLLYSIEKNQTDCSQDAISVYQDEYILQVADSIKTNELTQKITSKAGQYGWKKIDLGSQLLATQFENIVQSFDSPPNSFLDLGCGYGYLTLQTKMFKLKSRVATDNNAAALLSCEKNCMLNDIACQIIPSDTAKQIEPSFDWIACNPPFHKGFFNQPFLLVSFLQQAQRLLSKNGRACFVTNEFIPLEREAKKYFKEVTLLSHSQGFKVHMLNN